MADGETLMKYAESVIKARDATYANRKAEFDKQTERRAALDALLQEWRGVILPILPPKVRLNFITRLGSVHSGPTATVELVVNNENPPSLSADLTLKGMQRTELALKGQGGGGVSCDTTEAALILLGRHIGDVLGRLQALE